MKGTLIFILLGSSALCFVFGWLTLKTHLFYGSARDWLWDAGYNPDVWFTDEEIGMIDNYMRWEYEQVTKTVPPRYNGVFVYPQPAPVPLRKFLDEFIAIRLYKS